MSYIGGWRTGGRTKKCHNCQDPGHLSWACKEPKKCNNCQVPGHLAWECKEPRKAYGGGYAGAAARAVGGAGEEMDGGNRKDEEVRNLGTEKQVKAFWKKISFKRGMEMNHARMERGMKEKNYLLLLHKTGGEVTLAKIVEILDEMGIDFMQVMAINQHPDKLSSCVEILFKPELDVDLGEMNRKVGEIGLDYDVDPIGYSTETVHVRRIPLTANPKEVVDLIRQAISPYVTRIVDISPTFWKLTEKAKEHRFNMMLDGKLDGNYRVRFVPLEKVVIPGFIPIGPECVKAEVRYGKQDDRNLLCSNCFLEGHMKGDSACTASVEEGWMAYVDRFNQKSAELAVAQGLPANAHQSEYEKLKERYDKVNHSWTHKEARLIKEIEMLEDNGRKADGKDIDLLVSLRGDMKKKEVRIQKLKDLITEMVGIEELDMMDEEEEEEEEVKEAKERIKKKEEEMRKKEAKTLEDAQKKEEEKQKKKQEEEETEEKKRRDEEEKKTKRTSPVKLVANKIWSTLGWKKGDEAAARTEPKEGGEEMEVDEDEEAKRKLEEDRKKTEEIEAKKKMEETAAKETAAKQEAAAKEAAAKEAADKQEAEAKEAAAKDATAKQEAAAKRAAAKEAADKQEASRKEAAAKEAAAKQEASRKEAAAKEAASKQEASRKEDAAKKDVAEREAETSKNETAGKNAGVLPGLKIPERFPRKTSTGEVIAAGSGGGGVETEALDNTGKKTENKRCRTCAGCKIEDCNICEYCLDKPKNGGPNKKKQACKMRVCEKMKTKVVAAGGEKRKIYPLPDGESLSPLGKNIRKDDVGDGSLRLVLAPDTPEIVNLVDEEDESIDLLAEMDGLEELTDGQRIDGSSLSTFREDTVQGSLEMSSFNEVTRDSSGGMDIVCFASTSIETPNGTPVASPKASPVKMVTNKLLNSMGLRKSPAKMEFGNISVVKAQVGLWEQKKKGGSQTKPVTRLSLS